MSPLGDTKMLPSGNMSHVKGCWFCLFEKLLVIFGFAAIGLISVFAAFWDAVHWHWLMAGRDMVGYLIAVVAIGVVPKLMDRFHGLLDAWGF